MMQQLQQKFAGLICAYVARRTIADYICLALYHLVRPFTKEADYWLCLWEGVRAAQFRHWFLASLDPATRDEVSELI